MPFRLVKLIDPLQIVNIPSGLVPKGAYAAGTDYAVGDSVDYQGSSYVMFNNAAAGTAPTDTAYWQVLANKGATGATGATGAAGAAGATGADGADGVGVPVGGTIGQVLAKNSNTDYDTEWVDATVGGGGVSDGDKGDVTVSSSGATWTVDDAAITLAKQANLAQNTIIGRITGSTGVPEALSATDVRTIINVADGANVGVVPNAGITGATKTKITYDAKGLVTSGADATTADIADSTNKRYVTDAQSTVIGNTSGTNTGDNAVNSNYSSLTQYTDEMAQDAVGGMVNASLTYTDGTPELKVTNPVTPQTTGFTIAAGTTPKTLTVALDANVAGTNTGDQDLSGLVTKATYDAHTIVYATTDNTPVALTVSEQTVVGRATGGNITAIAIDSDLSSVSANDDSIPSAKATKAMGDLKLPLAGGTMSGPITLGENTSVALDPAGSADGKYSGITVTGTGGATIAFGDVVTLDKDDSRWELVDISVAAAATGDARGILGMAVTSSSDGGALTILLNGIIRADANFPALTIGAPVYASTTGDIVVAQPTTTDHVIRIVGYALTADEIYFNPGNTWTTHT